MEFNSNLRSQLLGGAFALVAGLALSGCNGDKSGAASSPANSSVTTSADLGASASDSGASVQADHDVDSHMEGMEQRHQQAMDHAEMRAGHSKADADPKSDSAAMPMKDM